MDRSAYGIIATRLTIASAFIASLSVAVSADDEALITQLAEFQKKQGLLAGYTANKGSYHLDVTISPTTPLATGEAGFAGRTTCSLGAQELASKLDHEWTVQVFVAGEATAAYTCESPPSQLKSQLAPRPSAGDQGRSKFRARAAIIFSDLSAAGSACCESSMLNAGDQARYRLAQLIALDENHRLGQGLSMSVSERLTDSN